MIKNPAIRSMNRGIEQGGNGMMIKVQNPEGFIVFCDRYAYNRSDIMNINTLDVLGAVILHGIGNDQRLDILGNQKRDAAADCLNILKTLRITICVGFYIQFTRLSGMKKQSPSFGTRFINGEFNQVQ